jgi:hypothetical protein
MTGRYTFRWEGNIKVDLTEIGCEEGKWTELLDPCCLLRAGFFLGLPLNPDDGGNIFLQHISWLLQDYTVLYPRR